MSQPRDRAVGAASAAVSLFGAAGHRIASNPHCSAAAAAAAATTAGAASPRDRDRERARAYLARLPVSVQGQGGHAAAFRAAGALVNGFALSEPDALPLLLEWNAQCLPPWSEAELRHKLRSARQNPGSRERGHLLERPPAQSSASYSAASARKSRRPVAPLSTATASHSTTTTTSHSTTATTTASASSTSPAAYPLPLDLAKKKARQRAAWPDLEALTHADIRAIATLRGMLPDAVDLAHRHGFLKTAVVDGLRCLVVREGTFAQARRLDGEPFPLADGTRIKAKNLPGSEAAFLGRRWLGTARHVLLVEGCIGLLEALAALLLVNMAESWTILAATSASSRFARDPELLDTLRHRHVRIIPDADPAGLHAAMLWLADLRQHGISHAAYPLPPGCKDLGDVLALPAARRDAVLQRVFHTP